MTEQCTNCRLCVWPLHRIHCQQACPSASSRLPSLIQMFMIPALTSAETEDDKEAGKSGDSSSDSEGQLSRPRPRDRLEGPRRRILLPMLMNNKHLHQRRPRDRLALLKRGDLIAPGNGKNAIGGRVRTTQSHRRQNCGIHTCGPSRLKQESRDHFPSAT